MTTTIDRSAGVTTVNGIKVIDADTHLTEPPDFFTSRLPRKWHEVGPRTEIDPNGIERWRIGDRWLSAVGAMATGGTGQAAREWDSVQRASTLDVDARLAWMDANGQWAQVLYPNIVALEGHAIMALDDEELKLACIRANNDQHADFAAQAPSRFVPLAAMPFWSIDACIAEMDRAGEAGHRGVIWAATLDRHGLPDFLDPQWDPFYDAAQAMEMSINFHVGVGYTAAQMDIATQRNTQQDPLVQAMDQARRTASGFMANSTTIAKLIMSDVVDKFPRLNFVSIESGYGFIPYLLEALDWQWVNPGKDKRFPHRLLPSEYFQRQIYAMFWFEQKTLPLLECYPDNVMFETDFPHDTSLVPGPGSNSPAPADVVAQHIANYGPELMNKVLFDNAARVYRL